MARTSQKTPQEINEPGQSPLDEVVQQETIKTPVSGDPDTTRPEPELSDEELRHRLSQELDRLAARIQEANPDFTPPPFSPQDLIDLIERNFPYFSPHVLQGILEKLRSGLSSDIFDPDTWKGVWVLLNYSLQYQTDTYRRRLGGEYETDEWGFDRELFNVFVPFFTFMYKTYWRVRTSGIQMIPDQGRTLLVSNHSGQLPWDGVMVGTAIYNEHPTQRLVRTLYAPWFPTLPFFSAFFVKMGQTLSTVDNGIRLLQKDELVAVYPEGYKGVGKLFKDRYKLAHFGRGDFVRMALSTGAPIIPVAVVGAEETYISLYKSQTLARLIGFPYFPIGPTFPWLGLLGLVPLPSKWYIDFGEPISTENHGASAADNLTLVSQLTDQVRNLVQDMVNMRLTKRRSVFFG